MSSNSPKSKSKLTSLSTNFIDLTASSIIEDENSHSEDVVLSPQLKKEPNLSTPRPPSSPEIIQIDESEKEPIPLIHDTLDITHMAETPIVSSAKTSLKRTSLNMSEDLIVVKTVVSKRRPISSPKPVITIPDGASPLRDNRPSEDSARKKCPICLDPFDNPMATMCGHVFCRDCISLVLKSAQLCPVCRKKVKSKSIHPIYM